VNETALKTDHFGRNESTFLVIPRYRSTSLYCKIIKQQFGELELFLTKPLIGRDAHRTLSWYTFSYTPALSQQKLPFFCATNVIIVRALYDAQAICFRALRTLVASLASSAPARPDHPSLQLFFLLGTVSIHLCKTDSAGVKGGRGDKGLSLPPLVVTGSRAHLVHEDK